MARLVGADSSVLAACELGRSKVSYSMAREVLNRFPDLCVRWLATGDGVMLDPCGGCALPALNSSPATTRSPLSLAWDLEVRHAWLASRSAIRMQGQPDPLFFRFSKTDDGRSQAASKIGQWLGDLMRQLPADAWEGFVRDVHHDMVRRFASLSVAPSDGDSASQRQALLDNPGPTELAGVVRGAPQSLDELLERLRPLLAVRGRKASLAAALGVSRQAVEQWVAKGERQRRPSADVAIRLLKWVRDEEGEAHATTPRNPPS